MADQRVMVSGAGLAGLVAAQALRHAGLQTRVFEQVPEMGPVGAIIGLTHRAASALEGMGRADLVESACIPVQGIEYFNWKGNALTRMPIAEVSVPRLPWGSGTAWLLVAVFALMASAYYGLNAWLPDAYAEHGWSDGRAGLLGA